MEWNINNQRKKYRQRLQLQFQIMPFIFWKMSFQWQLIFLSVPLNDVYLILSLDDVFGFNGCAKSKVLLLILHSTRVSFFQNCFLIYMRNILACIWIKLCGISCSISRISFKWTFCYWASCTDSQQNYLRCQSVVIINMAALDLVYSHFYP